jgi:hypothetical protein
MSLKHESYTPNRNPLPLTPKPQSARARLGESIEHLNPEEDSVHQLADFGRNV